MSETILLSVENSIATLTFNRPEQMNAFNDAMAREFADKTERILFDKSIRAVVLRGAGSLFMAGGDIHYFHQHLEQLPSGIFPLVRLLNAGILNLNRMQKPVVACVHGSVAGVGMSFMMVADLVIAGANTQFTMAYNKIGISPDGGASYFLPQIVGSKKAAELIMLSEIFDAKTAQQLGLINWVVDEAQLAEETGKLLKKLAQGPTHTYANSKKLIQQSSFHSLEQHLEAEAASFAQLSTTHDFKAGVTGFLKKEKPLFKGE